MPPYLHHTITTERAIQTCKDHFINGLSNCDPNLPLHLWDRLIPHVTLTLNLLCPSRLNLRLLEEAQLNDAFDFNCTPLAPSGMRVIVHKTPDNRRTWAPYGVYGWYIGPVPEYYRRHCMYIPHTCAERIAKTVEFLSHDCPVLASSSTSAATTDTRALSEYLLHPTTTPFATLSDEQFSAIKTLSRIF